MKILGEHLHEWDKSLPQVALRADRGLVAKRRWRGVAEDGEEFGFDLSVPLAHGDVFFASESAVYFLEQTPERILEIPLSSGTREAATLGWKLGNLHFQIEVTEDSILTPDDSAIRQLLEREHITFTAGERVFKPSSTGHTHDH